MIGKGLFLHEVVGEAVHGNDVVLSSLDIVIWISSPAAKIPCIFLPLLSGRPRLLILIVGILIESVLIDSREVPAGGTIDIEGFYRGKGGI